MVPRDDNRVVRRHPRQGTTGEDDGLEDRYGTIWRLVSSLPPPGTGDRQAVLMPDGRIVEK